MANFFKKTLLFQINSFLFFMLFLLLTCMTIFAYQKNLADEKKELLHLNAQMKIYTAILEEFQEDRKTMQQILGKIQKIQKNIPYMLVEKKGKYFAHSEYFGKQGLKTNTIKIVKTFGRGYFRLQASFYPTKKA